MPNKVDLVWGHKDTGAAYVWYLNGTQLLSDALLFTMDPGWKVQGAGVSSPAM